jgi:hypothetical protein
MDVRARIRVFSERFQQLINGGFVVAGLYLLRGFEEPLPDFRADGVKENIDGNDKGSMACGLS